ncbi:hypothetical protein [Wolbachia endosymbiont (group B) of Chorthippus brunneus]|uniref:hypothetical protein n=1 Tax=Wolbachia endosymbiont (group B) of Chorthippus brunneus TaxID=2953996 RepID=UPI0021F8243E|nr:hypothetical protein [Wolbachia endosymbiont (group B) of Chorthippus brunneus]
MPRKTERRTAVLDKLQSVIENTNSKIAAEKRLAIERWVKTYIKQIEYLEDNELQFLYSIFRDESCWSDTKLDNYILGQKLTEEKIDKIENPFCRYNMACRYCVVNKIYPLFQEQFESYKGRVSPGAVDIDGNPVDDKYIRNDLLDSMGSYDPAFSFWIDRESGTLKEYSNVDGFRKVVDLKWSEGVEYFYNRLNLQEREKEIINAVTTLSTIQCNYNRATVLDFCLYKMDDPAKRELLLKLSEKERGVYSLLNGLIRWSFLGTVRDMVKRWCYEEVSVPADKILSHHDYALLLSSLSNVMLESPESGVQARSITMDIWRCNRFNENKKAAVFSNGRVPIKRMLAGLIVDWERGCALGEGDTGKKDELLEILQFAKEYCTQEDFVNFKNYLISNLKMVGRPGMKSGVDYGKLAEELFSELDKLPIPHRGGGDFGGSGDPQSTLGSPGVSGLSGYSK